MTFMIGLGKAETRWDVNVERPSPWTNEAYRRFLEGDPAYITRLLRLWENAEPVALTTRMTYPIKWRHDDGRVVSFTATMHVADLWQDLTWHDWILRAGGLTLRCSTYTPSFALYSTIAGRCSL